MWKDGAHKSCEVAVLIDRPHAGRFHVWQGDRKSRPSTAAIATGPPSLQSEQRSAFLSWPTATSAIGGTVIPLMPSALWVESACSFWKSLNTSAD